MPLFKPRGEIPQSSSQTKLEKSVELLPTQRRIVIYGTRVDGAPEMAANFEDFLQQKGIQNTVVEYCRDVSVIERAFFNNGNEPCVGVVILPTMRTKTDSGMGITVDTPVEYIIRLCQENGVPFVDLSNSQQSGDIQTSILQLSS